jgi:hypothetical protein
MLTNRERIKANAQQSATEDLLDRITVYREGMEPDALEMIQAELLSRGITEDAIDAHLAQRGEVLHRPDGSVVECSFCRRPAIRERWGWHRLQGRGLAALLTLLPLYRPRHFAYCGEHLPEKLRKGPLTSTADPPPPG